MLELKTALKAKEKLTHNKKKKIQMRQYKDIKLYLIHCKLHDDKLLSTVISNHQTKLTPNTLINPDKED